MGLLTFIVKSVSTFIVTMSFTLCSPPNLCHLPCRKELPSQHVIRTGALSHLSIWHKSTTKITTPTNSWVYIKFSLTLNIIECLKFSQYRHLATPIPPPPRTQREGSTCISVHYVVQELKKNYD